jgi:hypothetical protein
MLQRLVYPHRFLGIIFLTINCTKMNRIDFSKIHFDKSKTSPMLVRTGELSSPKSANSWINPLAASEFKI